MWIQAQGKFAQAYGEVSSSLKQMKITMEKSGSYDVLLIGTRKDVVARSHWNKIGGVEALISGSKFEHAVPGDSININFVFFLISFFILPILLGNLSRIISKMKLPIFILVLVHFG